MTISVVFRQSLSQSVNDDDEQIMFEECQQLRELQQGFQVPQVQVPDERSKPLGLGGITNDDLDFSQLVEMRRQHQTRHAALGIRTRSSKATDTEDSEISLKQQIIRRMREVLKEQSDRAVGTGCERSVRWGVLDRDAGNSANAAAAAATVAKRVSHSFIKHAYPVTYHRCWQAATHRNDIFKKADVPCLSEVKNARVSPLRPLRIGDYGIVVTEHGLRVAQGKHLD